MQRQSEAHRVRWDSSTALLVKMKMTTWDQKWRKVTLAWSRLRGSENEEGKKHISVMNEVASGPSDLGPKTGPARKI